VISDLRLRIALVLLTTVLSLRQLCAQEAARTRQNAFYAGYSFLSNSFNDYAEFSGTPLNGWHVALDSPVTSSLSVSIDGLGFYGTNLGDSQIEHSLLVGPQWTRQVGKESAFVHGLIGAGVINSGAIPFDNSKPSSNITFAALTGCGLDTPLSPHLAWRVEGDYLRSQYGSDSNQIHNLRGNFAHFTTGFVFRF
jgi:hypothetical protein